MGGHKRPPGDALSNNWARIRRWSSSSSSAPTRCSQWPVTLSNSPLRRVVRSCLRGEAMTTSATDELYYDPWHADLNADPYPMFKRFRDEAPVYYNDVHDFYALSRFDDVNRALVDYQSLSSARGAVLEIIKSDIEIPSGLLVFEDPPVHDIHRNLLARAFTPRKIKALEPMIRDFTRKCLDAVDGDRFDFVKD